MKHAIFPVAVIFALILATGILVRDALAQAKTAQARTQWEYGLLTIGNGEPTFTTAKQQSIARPPTGLPTNYRSSDGQYADKINVITKNLWTTDLMMMDQLGGDGWEAVAMMSIDAKHTSVLMRRPLDR